MKKVERSGRRRVPPVEGAVVLCSTFFFVSCFSLIEEKNKWCRDNVSIYPRRWTFWLVVRLRCGGRGDWWTWGFDIGGWKIEIRLDRKNVISRFFFFFPEDVRVQVLQYCFAGYKNGFLFTLLVNRRCTRR